MLSILLRGRSRTFSNLIECSRTFPNLVFLRSMGGGPRTFPGGLNKWQWKRMHEKKAREKERGLLEQEKQLYQARIRSEIRARLAGNHDTSSSGATTHDPMSPRDQIKALADRFMKEGAEDLWNEDDGPLRPPEPIVRSVSRSSREVKPVETPIDLRKLVSDASSSNNSSVGNRKNVNFMNGNDYNYISTRKYSVASRRFRRNESSCSEDDVGTDSKANPLKLFTRFTKGGDQLKDKNMSFPKQKKRIYFKNNDSSSSDDDDEEEEEELDSEYEMEKNKGTGGAVDVKRMGSSAALGKYDVKIKKRVPLKFLEEETDFAQEVEMIRYEMSKTKSIEMNEEDSILSEKRFEECDISPLTIKALSFAGYVQMTRVQEATISVCLDGKDVLVKAKTGTGKSLAFLLPAIETVLKVSSNGNHRVPPTFVLILCPTRELASQIAAEAKALLKYHEGIGVQTLVGGTRFKDDQKRLESDPCQIIVATPGRLIDHIESKSGLSVRLMGLKMLIVDEADHLLDLGFRRDIEKVVDCLPRQRQSMLLSATIPKEVRRVSQLVLKREHAYIDTVGLGCVETPAKVKQSFLIIPHDLHFHTLYHILKEHVLQVPDYKVMVFCTTGMVTTLLYSLLREMRMNVREIHSRKPQLYRTRISNEFRESKQQILITSDVSARGMNYPDVTLVIQVGIPPDREQYIHRLGRTGREGKEGECILLLAPWEEYFLDDIKDLPIEKLPLPSFDPSIKLKIDESLAKIDTSIKEGAYHAWLGYYNSIREIGRDKTTLVELANQFSESIGLQNPPSLFRKTALKMGLKDIPGIRIRK